jgi:signal transduction histidine kinase
MADEQAALGRVATLAARGAEPDRVFAAVATEVAALIGADFTAVLRFETDGTVTFRGGHGWPAPDMRRLGERWRPEPPSATAAVRQTGRSARLENADTTPLPGMFRQAIRCAVASPIVVDGRLWGTIEVASRSGPLPADAEQRMVDFTEIVAIAIANTESRAELAASRARVIAAGDATRRRIERDLHDGAQQRLVSLALELRDAEAAIPPGLPDLRADLAQAAGELTEALDQLREISRGIHPAILSEGGLGPALRTLARRAGVPVELDVRTQARFPEPVEVAAYYVVSEAVTNTTKHAAASYAEVVVAERDEALWLRVRDDGAGGADPRRGSGLTGLRDRVEALGGAIHVSSPVGDGTQIEVSLPLRLG